MKFSILLLSSILAIFSASAQPVKPSNKKAILELLSTFMGCLVKKDSVTFYSLFHEDPVVWVGVTQQKSFEVELKKDPAATDYFSATYKEFYRSFYNSHIEEKFSNVQISADGYIAAVIFDYSFWFNNKKINRGKESWGLIKTKGQWKITNVLFSIEYEAINPSPVTK